MVSATFGRKVAETRRRAYGEWAMEIGSGESLLSNLQRSCFGTIPAHAKPQLAEAQQASRLEVRKPLEEAFL
jgi:hypothetical protein